MYYNNGLAWRWRTLERFVGRDWCRAHREGAHRGNLDILLFISGKFDVLVGTFDSGAVRRLGSGDLECHRRRLE